MRYLPTISCSFFLCLLFILPSSAHARDTLLNIQEVMSPGGITAWLVQDSSIPVIALKFAFRDAGAAHDGLEKQGLARLVSNTMDEGAGDLDSQSFQQALKDHSISLSFSAGRDNFSGSLRTLTRNKDKAFELLTLALTQPRFDEEPLGRMRAANQSRIRSSLSNPDWIAARLLNDVTFEGHPYAMNSGGTLSSLEAITSDDLRQFHTRFLGKNNLVVSAAGDISKEELGAILDQVFGMLPELKLPTPLAKLELQNQGNIYLYNKDIPQTIIEILQPGIEKTDSDYHNAKIMNFILGSSGFGTRLTKTIREDRGLTYGIYSHLINMDHFSGLGISTSTKNENVAEILKLIKDEWQKMHDEPITEKELASAKSYLIGALPLSLTSTNKIAGLLLSLQLDDLPINYLDMRQTAIEAAQIEDIKRVSERLLAPESMTTILVGSPNDLTVFDNLKIIERIPNVE